MKRRKIYKRITASLLAMLLAVPMTVHVTAADSSESEDEKQNLFYVENFTSYQEYLKQYADSQDATKSVVVQCGTYADDVEKTELEDRPCVLIPEEKAVEYQIAVEQSGFYNLELLYYPMGSTTTAFEVDLQIDGDHPFEGTSSITLPRIWGFSDEKKQDSQGNDIRCDSVQQQEWTRMVLENTSGAGGDNLRFYLEAGEHTISIKSLQGQFALAEVSFVPPKQVLSYEKTLAQWEDAGYKDATESLELIQAEQATKRSEKSIAMENDRMSAATTPYHSYKIRYNYIGGGSWSNVGEWVEWEVDVKESGLYTLACRFLQNEKTSDISTRVLTIDNELPFAEAACIAFPYSNSWQTTIIGDGEEAYKFYLEEGKHTIRMEAALGETAEVINGASSILDRLNSIYVDIVMVTGTEPDVNRDYGIAKLLPDVLEEMKTSSQELKELEELQNEVKGNEEGNSTFERLYQQLDKMVEEPEDIPRRLSNFQTNITSLGTWINTSRTQPLAFDYLQILTPEEEVPKAEKGFFANVKHNVMQFLGSFLMDYSKVGSTETETDREITVWIGSGRDQADIMQKMINTEFTPESGIGVNLQLVGAGSLLPATLAGIGPDVFIGVAETEPVNYALRHAAVDLTKLDGYDEVISRFHSASVTPFELDGGVYALPETMNYPMLFYRKDILNELGIKEEDLTQWDTLLQNVLPELMLSYFDFGMLPDEKNFEMLLYQHGGTLYNEEHTASKLDSTEAYSAFDIMTRLYTDYKIPKSYDFVNRFRSGQMPLAIASYSAYNQLSVFAPEIEGKWGMTTLPGTVDEEGNKVNTAVATVTGSIILSNSDSVDDAWTFLKWWSQGSTQSEYASELESALGTSARLATANIEAFDSIQWNSEIRQALKEQQENLKGIPQIAGSYYTGRYFSFAFRDVVEQGENTRESLLESCENITTEIQDKRKEFYGEGE